MPKGFTLVEVLMVIAITALLFAGALTFSNRFLVSSNFNTTVLEIKNTLLIAQNRAVQNFDDSNSGVHFDNTTYTLFTGDTFDPDSTSNLSTTFSEVLSLINVDFNGTPTIYFEKFTGLPLEAGSFTVDTGQNQSATISVDSAGIIEITYNQ